MAGHVNSAENAMSKEISGASQMLEGKLLSLNAKKASDGTVGKALGVLDQVAEFGRPVRFGELLDQSKHPKATLYRFLQTLVSQRLLAYDTRDQTYSLGIRLVRLAHAAWKQSTLAPVAAPFIAALAQEVGETIHLAQMDNGQVLFVGKRKTIDQFETLAQTGMVAPAYCTGVGKAILAYLPPERRQRALLQQAYLKYTPATHASAESLSVELNQIHADGVAFDREEHERGIISIAAPILTDGGNVIGALSIATSTTRHSLKGLNSFRPALLHAAEKIGVEAAVWQFPS